jgi:hypothetical protein
LVAFVWAVAAALALVVAAACGDSKSPQKTVPASPTEADPAAMQALARAEGSLEAGYTVTITAGGFVLPGFGPIDAGTVQVGEHAEAVQAQVRRSGDTAAYTLVYAAGQTYFRRAGCDAFAKLADGADTFDALLFPKTHALRDGAGPHMLDSSGRVVVDTTIAGLGEALVQADPADGHLVTIVFGDQPDNAGHLGFTFDFSDLGKPLQATAPAATDIATPGPDTC